MEATLKRIDPADAPGLFERVGMRPIRRRWGGPPIEGAAGDDLCVCLLTALVADRFGPAEAFRIVREIKERSSGDVEGARLMGGRLGLHPDYAVGLLYGWDGKDYAREAVLAPAGTDLGALRAGHDDGRGAAEAVS